MAHLSELDLRIIEAWRSGDEDAFIQGLAEVQAERIWRPRDEFDADVHPDSLRGHVLALYDAEREVLAEMDAAIKAQPWWHRLYMRPAFLWATRKVRRHVA